MVNDWVVGLVGRIIDAPVAEPRVVELAQDMPPKLARLGWAPGVYFASRWVPNEPILDYQQAVAEAAKQEGNRFPLALLAVLWAAFFAKDGQLVRRSDGSAMLTSIDHDLFFPGGADWSFNDLEHPRSHPNWKRPFRCKDLAAHLAPAVNALKAIEKEAFSEVVKGVPQQWGLDDRDRIALRKFLENLPTFETDVNSWNSEADL